MMQDDGPTFGRLLRDRRLVAGMTQESLAEAAGLSIRGVQELERGLHQPYRDTVERLSRALDLSAADRARLARAARPRGRGRDLETTPRGEVSHIPDEPISRPRHNLPIELTSFVGRQSEVAQVRELLASARLLTLTGTGGCGKTRLALRAAAELVDAFPDGVWLVELATVADSRLVCQSIASALARHGSRPRRPLLDSLRAEIGSAALLLLLDNCEHLVEACARASRVPASDAARTCRFSPRAARRFATRRREPLAGALALAARSARRLPSAELALGYEAVQALRRAREAGPSRLRADRRQRARWSEICARLDGIPLAIELAAARHRGALGRADRRAARRPLPPSHQGAGRRSAASRRSARRSTGATTCSRSPRGSCFGGSPSSRGASRSTPRS